MYTAVPFQQCTAIAMRTAVSIMTWKTSNKDSDEDEHNNSADNDDDEP